MKANFFKDYYKLEFQALLSLYSRLVALNHIQYHDINSVASGHSSSNCPLWVGLPRHFHPIYLRMGRVSTTVPCGTGDGWNRSGYWARTEVKWLVSAGYPRRFRVELLCIVTSRRCGTGRVSTTVPPITVAGRQTENKSLSVVDTSRTKI